MPRLSFEAVHLGHIPDIWGSFDNETLAQMISVIVVSRLFSLQ